MYTVDKHTLKFIATYILAITLGGVAGGLLSSCSDETIETGANVDNDGKGTGEMVMFSVGTTDNTITRASEAKTYYMPYASRFICRMYYKAQAGSDTLDITGGSDQIAWLKVSGNVGNSLYWNKDYNAIDENTKGKGGVDEYGNDYSATAFYWQNRKEHAFLAWTDLNHATTITGGSDRNQLKFNEDEIYKIYTGASTTQWVTKSYEIYGVDASFNSLSEMQDYVQTEQGKSTIGESVDFKTHQDALSKEKRFDWSSDANYHYQHGWQYKYSTKYAAYDYNGAEEATATTRDFGWTQYMMFFEKIPFSGSIPADAEKVMDPMNEDLVIFIKDKNTHKYIAATEVKKNAEGKFLDAEGNETKNPANYAYNYYLTDEYGNIFYNENNPKYTFYFRERQNKEDMKVVEEFPALAFDLTRGTKQSMSEQPDIVQAVEIQAPTGATQESNRVNLYFKHQFSQLQVNLKNAADNSVTIVADDILKVELLGVSEKGYVFTELDKDGKVKPAAYKEIDFSDYSEEQLKDNQFGTAFEMFDMRDDEKGEAGNWGYAYDYLKSYNAIAYGQLQAIRITWKENDTNYTHAATYRIPDTDLMNLQSGVRYVWNIEIRRGTLAIIRTEIVDWELPEEEEYNGSADGTIQN